MTPWGHFQKGQKSEKFLLHWWYCSYYYYYQKTPQRQPESLSDESSEISDKSAEVPCREILVVGIFYLQLAANTEGINIACAWRFCLVEKL